MVGFNSLRFCDLFSDFSYEMQEMAYDRIRCLSCKSIFGLSSDETIILRKYLSDVNGRPFVLNDDELMIINSDVFKNKLFIGVLRDRYRIELADAEKSIRGSIDFRDKKQLQLVSQYTVTQLMDMFGIGAYPLIKYCEGLGFFPLDDKNSDGDKTIRCVSFSSFVDSMDCREEFMFFKQECVLRQLINTDDKDSLSFVSRYTVSELKDMFDGTYDILEMYCKREGVSPLFDSSVDNSAVKVKSKLS